MHEIQRGKFFTKELQSLKEAQESCHGGLQEHLCYGNELLQGEQHRDEQGCATLLGDAPSLEDTGPGGVQSHCSNTEERKTFPSEGLAQITLK